MVSDNCRVRIISLYKTELLDKKVWVLCKEIPNGALKAVCNNALVEVQSVEVDEVKQQKPFNQLKSKLYTIKIQVFPHPMLLVPGGLQLG